MAYAMENLGWKFYFINAAWNFVFLVIAYFVFVETKGLTLEEINCKFERTSSVIEGIEEETSQHHSLGGGKQGDILANAQELR